MRTLILCLFLFPCIIYAQDPSFSQFDLNMMNNNPAFASYEGGVRILLHSRNQWNRIKITQRLQPDSTYSFEATLNDLAFFSKAEISDPQIWNNVDIYAADAFYSPATAKIKNLQVFRINSIPGLIYYPYTL